MGDSAALQAGGQGDHSLNGAETSRHLRGKAIGPVPPTPHRGGFQVDYRFSAKGKTLKAEDSFLVTLELEKILKYDFRNTKHKL